MIEFAKDALTWIVAAPFGVALGEIAYLFLTRHDD